MAEHDQADLTTLTVELLSAYFTNNTVSSDSLSGLIQSTYSALAGIDAPSPVEPDAPTYTPAVSVRKSLSSRDHIISMIDGKPYKTLKRHLSANGLSPAEYRERYNLPAGYPLVAPSFSEARRAVAAKHGLGGSKKRNRVDAAPTGEEAASADLAIANDDAAPAKAPPKARTTANKPASRGTKKASSADLKSDAPDLGSGTPGEDLTPQDVQTSEAAPAKPRRKLKIKAGGPSASSDTQNDDGASAPAAKRRKAKSSSADAGDNSEAPKPAKRAYKKRAPKTA